MARGSAIATVRRVSQAGEKSSSDIDQAKTEYAAGRLPGNKQALDALVAAYNLARESWITYRGALAVNAPAEGYLLRLTSNLTDLTNAIRQFEEAK